MPSVFFFRYRPGIARSIEIDLANRPGDLASNGHFLKAWRDKLAKKNRSIERKNQIARSFQNEKKNTVCREFKSAPHISPGALCAACDPMATQPGSGLPAKAISFMEYPGLFERFIEMDAKTNETIGFEHFTCNPSRDPDSEKNAQK